MINDPNAIDDVVIANLKQRARRKNRDGRKWDHWITMPNAEVSMWVLGKA